MPGRAHPVRLAPSLLSADFADLASAIRSVEEAGADALHLDVMDGHFVPNISFGPALVSAVRKRTRLPLDVHLMVERPLLYVEPFSTAGGDTLVVHVESADPVTPTLRTIRRLGARVGLAIKPETSLSEGLQYLDDLDEFMVMGVHPGFSGQSMVPGTMERLKGARGEIDRRSRTIELALDGGVTVEWARRATDRGATFLVCGQSVFGEGTIGDNLRALRSAVTPVRPDAVP